MGVREPIYSAVKRKVPPLDLNDSLREAIKKINTGNSSALAVKDQDDEAIGVITDMDLMYGIVQCRGLDAIKAAKFMTRCQLITGKPVKSPCVQLYEGKALKIPLLS